METESPTFPEGPSLDEYIAMLQKLRAQVGSGAVRVQKWLPIHGRMGAPEPRVAFKRVYDAKRLSDAKAPQFYNEAHDRPIQKGEAVIRV